MAEITNVARAELSVMENFYGAGRRDIATCKENSAACVSKIRDIKNYFYLLHRYGKSAISHWMTDNIFKLLVCLNKTGTVRINVPRRVRATIVAVGKG